MIRFRVIEISRDRRSDDLKARGEALEKAFATADAIRAAQAKLDAADAAIERLWRARVRDNVLGIRRARDEHKLALVKRQAS